MEKKKRMKKALILTVKIAIGSSVAIYIAQLIELSYATSAGTITLLTVMTTKWEAVRLSLYRLLTFIVTVMAGWLTFAHLESTWLAYGIFIFMIVLLSEVLGWRATISVNALIGTHFMTSQDFGIVSVGNEFLLMVIGLTIAVFLSLFHDNVNSKKELIANIQYVEKKMQIILGELAAYLSDEEMKRSVWDDIRELERELHVFVQYAYEYQDNTFQSHPGYYIDYYEMRLNQCHILHNLHYEMKKIRGMPKQAQVVADFIVYLIDCLYEKNVPTLQLEELSHIFEKMKLEALPTTREEFESRAILYHILTDIEDLLVFKSRFVKGLSKQQLEKYWHS
jgi:uncharacterized membrane protein YgaE (UPF0421/DUF939 family)